jgi:hypothetical protein
VWLWLQTPYQGSPDAAHQPRLCSTSVVLLRRHVELSRRWHCHFNKRGSRRRPASTQQARQLLFVPCAARQLSSICGKSMRWLEQLPTACQHKRFAAQTLARGLKLLNFHAYLVALADCC